jgi:hypothetical protein
MAAVPDEAELLAEMYATAAQDNTLYSADAGVAINAILQAAYCTSGASALRNMQERGHKAETSTGT